MKALINHYGGRFIFVARINRVASNGYATLEGKLTGKHINWLRKGQEKVGS